MFDTAHDALPVFFIIHRSAREVLAGQENFFRWVIDQTAFGGERAQFIRPCRKVANLIRCIHLWKRNLVRIRVNERAFQHRAQNFSIARAKRRGIYALAASFTQNRIHK